MKDYAFDDLGRRATPDEMKAGLLELLTAFDAFCAEHGLRYCLSGGTLLGAVRHQGFIPWDDDVDVNMPRPDCERLMELSGGRIGRFELMAPNCTDKHHAYHWKLFHDSFLVCKKATQKVYPIFMDIFPIEGLPGTMEETRRHYRTCRKWKYLANCLWGRKWLHGKDLKAKLFHAAFRPLAALYGRERLFRRVLGVMTEIPFDGSPYVGVMATNVHQEVERVVRDKFLPRIDVTFEGRIFPGPANYDTYLRQLYGADYMQLPPPEKRKSHHGLIPHFTASAGGRPLRIALFGLVKSDNLGEEFIARSLEYLIERECRVHGLTAPVEFTEIDLLGRNDVTVPATGKIQNHRLNYWGYRVVWLPLDFAMRIVKRLSRHIRWLPLRNLVTRFARLIYWCNPNLGPRLRSYFLSKLRGADFIVVDGAGLLEYAYNEYQEPLLLVADCAKRQGLDVVYNAIGRAGKVNEKDFRCSILKRALQADCVKYVSARDSVETVQLCAGAKHRVKLLADAAFWMKDVFSVPVVERRKIGIGIIRGNALRGYGFKFDEEDWIRLFSGIAREFEKRGFAFEFFTNGLNGDIVLGKKILARMGLPDEFLVPQPTEGHVLYETINGYAGIITCRMHSAIAAFTLGVPSLILSWNDKVDKLMAIVGCPERVVKASEFDAETVVERFEAILKKGVDPAQVEKMKALALESVDDYVDLVVRSHRG